MPCFNHPNTSPPLPLLLCQVNSPEKLWGGLMWVIGWRRSYNKYQSFGWYITNFGPEYQIAFTSHYFKSSWVGEIIGELFEKFAHEPPGKKVRKFHGGCFKISSSISACILDVSLPYSV
ncbi:hypothetical protein VP01_5478g1 [Puccinia sorghi]|uniref:Tet-like 2OG-Fe(II) oxygenase domain-containing protein n=1 Tax=Puccinia sorghi TaxID=27349 RepID=A0A0L6UJK6_9BASI|nr:hypothetical protein VP01_5478g1 [Puccinia sorghi]